MYTDSLETIATPYGRFTVDMQHDRKIGTGLKSGRYHQQDLLHFFQTNLSKESIMVDVGAHIGTITVPCARWAGQVIAFEPAPTSFALLEHNAAQNGVKIDAHNTGLSSLVGYATLVEKNAHNAGAQTLSVGEGSIPLSTLDREVESADFIKID